MASWGLAYEYGKNAYEDMWRKQEENDRYAAQRKLFDLKLKAEEAEQETYNREQARSLAVRDTINAYQNDLMSGGSKGRQAFVDALNQMGIGAQLVDGTKVVFLGADGKPDASNVIDMSDTSKWTGPAMMAELTKRVGTAVDESAKFTAEQEKNKLFKWEQDKFYTEEQGKNDRAALAAQNQLNIASMYARASAAKSSSGGRGYTSADYDEIWKSVGRSAVSQVMPKNVSIIFKDGGYSFIDLTTNSEYLPTKEEASKFNEIMNTGVQQAFINNGMFGLPSGLAGTQAGTAQGNEWVRNQNAIAEVGRSLDEFAARAKKASDEVLGRPANSDSFGSMISFYNNDYDPDNPTARVPTVTGRITNTQIPFGLSFPTGGESTPYPFGLTVVK